MTELIFKSDIDVEYVQHMGSDQMIAHAAWVSTRGIRDEPHSAEPGKVYGILKFLMEKRHGTPFECSGLTVRVHAPIKVWREWHRHRLMSYNEESGRYKTLDPVFYIPPRERPMIRPEGFKSSRPAFDTATDEEYAETVRILESGYQNAYYCYEKLLAMQVDRGLARDVLGVGIYSACYVTANPRSIMHFLELRTNEPLAKRPSAPLWEIDNAARKLEAIFAEHWPLTHELWNVHGRQSP